MFPKVVCGRCVCRWKKVIVTLSSSHLYSQFSRCVGVKTIDCVNRDNSCQSFKISRKSHTLGFLVPLPMSCCQIPKLCVYGSHGSTNNKETDTQVIDKGFHFLKTDLPIIHSICQMVQIIEHDAFKGYMYLLNSEPVRFCRFFDTGCESKNGVPLPPSFC